MTLRDYMKTFQFTEKYICCSKRFVVRRWLLTTLIVIRMLYLFFSAFFFSSCWKQQLHTCIATQMRQHEHQIIHRTRENQKAIKCPALSEMKMKQWKRMTKRETIVLSMWSIQDCHDFESQNYSTLFTVVPNLSARCQLYSRFIRSRSHNVLNIFLDVDIFISSFTLSNHFNFLTSLDLLTWKKILSHSCYWLFLHLLHST